MGHETVQSVLTKSERKVAGDQGKRQVWHRKARLEAGKHDQTVPN